MGWRVLSKPHTAANNAFLSLPPEILHLIVDNLSSKDTKVLRLTCHRLASVLAIHVLRSLTLEVNSSRHREELLRLQKLADGGSFEAEKVQELYVGTMAPRYCPSRPRCKDKFDWDYHPPPSETEMQEASVAEAELETRLFQAISSLKNVTFFHWRPHIQDPEWAQQTLLDAVLTLPNLERLDIDVTDCKVPIPFGSFGPLTELSISGNACWRSLWLSIGQLLDNSPNMASLNLDGSHCTASKLLPTGSRHSIDQSPAEFLSRQLRRLSSNLSSQASLPLFDFSLPRLSHLTSLTLLKVSDPFAAARPQSWSGRVNTPSKLGSADDFDFSTPQLLERPDVWQLLASDGVWVTNLRTDYISPSLLSYLESYHTLSELHLKIPNVDSSSIYDRLANRFFRTTLMRHSRALRDLDIHPDFESHWCFSSRDMDALSQCSNLKSLAISILSSEIEIETADPCRNASARIIATLLAFVSSHLPVLDNLTIRASSTTDLHSYSYRQGSGAAITHFLYTYRQIHHIIKGYEAPPECQRLPGLCVGSDYSYLPAFKEKRGLRRKLLAVFAGRGKEASAGRRMVYRVIHATTE